MKALAPLLLVLGAAPAHAWESTCYTWADRTLEASAYPSATGPYCAPDSGPNTARQRWVGGLDEHRQLWEYTREQAGLPSELGKAIRLRVFTGRDLVQIGQGLQTSLTPVPFESATRIETRVFTPGELSQLPDFSYALWDWATGHETCPLDGAGVDATACHDFASHMGPVNSNHFLPQAENFYARYHQLALGRADACKQLATAVAGTGARFQAYVKACEAEALTLEAVGHHYLQDAWSMGHMWQRWGSPNLSDFPGDDARDRAVLVALTAGLIHGSRGVLQRIPAWTSYDVNDALCAPNDEVRFVASDGTVLRAIGDDFLAQLSAPEWEAQRTRMMSCTTSGMLAVYQAAGSVGGPVQPLATGLSSVDPTSDFCFGQRATNRSMLKAAAVQLRVGGQQVELTLDSRLVGWLVPKVARNNGSVPVAPRLRNQFRFELQRAVTMTRLYTQQNPEGTEAADGKLGTFLGAKPNGEHGLGLSSYVDPSLPWPSTPDADPRAKERATALARVFHQAHAADWCVELQASQLEAMKAHALDSTLDAEGKAAACEVCSEFAVRHLRVGSPAAYDTSREPLCHHLPGTTAYLYQAGSASQEPLALARTWCGC